MRCGEDHEVGCGPCGRAVQAEPLVVNPGNTAWRFGHCTFKTPNLTLNHAVLLAVEVQRHILSVCPRTRPHQGKEKAAKPS